MKNIKDKFKLVSELSVQETPETNWMESFPWGPHGIFKDKSKWRTARIYIFVYRNGIIIGSQKRNSRFWQKKKEVWLKDLNWVDLRSFRGKCKFFICTIEQICRNTEVGNEKCWLGLENMYTYIWFLWVFFQAGMMSEHMPNALFITSKVITYKRI